ncbi:MAG TPA: branched-chain amino acid ABC transporter ATP-binding protein/permease [Candidatus Baltobacteraceae bacterium]|nr:branched-chain amino acid ABC transporter ATP-binding protein/permease [Candidatus Baltobacteraceae bacterium]
MKRWLLFQSVTANLGLLAVLLVLPFALEHLKSTALMASQILIFAVVGLGFNILLGYTGLLSFGHGMFLGMGMFGATLTQLHLLRGAFWGPIAVGTLCAALTGTVVGFLLMRRRGVYFSLLTLAFTQLFFTICYRWTDVTGGENGLSGLKRPEVFGLDLRSDYIFYYVCLILLGACVLLIRRIIDAPFGRVLQAIRDNEVRAASVGYNARRYKHVAVIISGTFLGFAGALFAFLNYFAYPEVFHAAFSGSIVAMTIVGGMRNFFGPIIGAAVYVFFQDLLSSYTKHWMIFFGLMFMAFILFSPNGMMGILQNFRNRFRSALPDAAAAPPVAAASDPGVPAEVPNRRVDPALLGPEIFRIEGVTKRFGALAAVDGVTFSVSKGELRSVIGPNGAGKTTLFNVLTGNLAIDGGKVSFKGEDITGLEPHQIARHGIARSFQILSIFKDLTVFENIRVAVQSTTPHRFALFTATDELTAINQEAERIVQQVGLGVLRDQIAMNISHGDQRLLEIGITLAMQPELLMLDEPLAGLAAKERIRIANLIRGLAGEHTIILIDHDIDQILNISDRITVLAQGKVIAEGTPDEIKANPQVQEAYIGGFDRKHLVAHPPQRRTDTPLLEVDRINTFYGKSHILHDVSLTVHPGELVCLLGRNGAGKTTTLHSIIGLVPPARGEVRFAGRPVARLQPEQISREGVMIVPQGRRIFPNLTVEENLGIAAIQAGRNGRPVVWTPARAYDLLPQLGRLRARRGEQMSGGELQMLAIARALMQNGQLLMLDEPFEGLAPTIVEGLWKVINQLKKEMTILLVEQNADLALSLGDRVYVVNNGKIDFEGSAQALIEDHELRVKLLGV